MTDFLEWNQSRKVGNEPADAVHQQIVHMVNTFLNGLVQGKAEQILDSILDHLIEISHNHFRDEEKMMKKLIDPPLFSRHKEQHDNLLKELRMLRDGYARAKLGIDDVLPFFQEWVFEHIEKMDKISYKQIE